MLLSHHVVGGDEPGRECQEWSVSNQRIMGSCLGNWITVIILSPEWIGPDRGAPLTNTHRALVFLACVSAAAKSERLRSVRLRYLSSVPDASLAAEKVVL